MDKHLWAAGKMEWSEWYELFLQISIQVIFNATSKCSDDDCEAVWSLFVPDCFV